MDARSSIIDVIDFSQDQDDDFSTNRETSPPPPQKYTSHSHSTPSSSTDADPPTPTPTPTTSSLASSLDCKICFEPFSASSACSFGCAHLYCLPCLRQLISVAVRTGAIDDLVCPMPCCGARPAPALVNEISPELFEDYERRAADFALRKDPNVRWCPNAQCGRPWRRTQEALGKDAVGCEACGAQICPECAFASHPGKRCADNEAFMEMQAYMREHANSKLCPLCQNMVEKRSGCNNIKCPSCGKHFCWICEMDIEVERYDHFANSTCKNRLWSKANNLDEMRERRTARQQWRKRHPIRSAARKTGKIALIVPVVIVLTPIVIGGALIYVIVRTPYRAIKNAF